MIVDVHFYDDAGIMCWDAVRAVPGDTYPVPDGAILFDVIVTGE